jgi:regulator of PEP synthase PpsR (kinase-PPPase family)
MLTAVLTQFPAGAVVVRHWPFLHDEAALRRALDAAADEGGAVLHALVSPHAKNQVESFCTARSIPHEDLTGRLVKFLAGLAGVQPSADPRALHRVDEAYHLRIGAIEFTLSHDDGLGLDTLDRADVVLVGVSRTSKTPTSIYLAQLGFHTANVSLASQVEPPAELLTLAPSKVVGLLIDPVKLADIRSRRQREWQMAQTSYSAIESVRAELAWSRKLFARQGWPTLDVTSLAVEETAARVLNLLRLPPAAGVTGRG